MELENNTQVIKNEFKRNGLACRGRGGAGSCSSSSNRCTGCVRKSIVKKSGPDAFEDGGAPISKELILARKTKERSSRTAKRRSSRRATRDTTTTLPG